MRPRRFAGLDRVAQQDRVPPGQTVTKGWPVLHAGPVPSFNPKTWDFEVYGEVERPMIWTFPQWMQLERKRVTVDIHCVTTWSKLGMTWGGVPFKLIEEICKPKLDARFVLQEAEFGYTTNLPIDDYRRDDVLVADWADGKPLEPDHGGPVRMMIPHRYFWKSAKWLRKLRFSAEDERGFWEVRGYHNRADPWTEERYSSQEDPPYSG
ncbi:MAG TPA: sulfite oxidase-like oxidoreductase [Candidatus Thermoplasmatota archaeon]|jgi:DMSO/TMAO reductase YedYZ molybdopterin-dependent catalytic subunit|nr:sulfite oxidase-like oxidoreductase [Candidatus Thermoplasmatota archaeon]